VPLFSFGPGRPVGLLDSPEIGTLTARALGLDLDALNRRLHVDLRQAIPHAEVRVVASAPNNLVVRVTLGDKEARLPVNKNVLVLNGEASELEGTVVFIPATNKVYVPLQAVQRITDRQTFLPSVAG
jgi:alkaline phosphatase